MSLRSPITGAVAAFALLAAGYTAAAEASPTRTCATAGFGRPYHVLVVGDSWASQGRLDSTLAASLAQRRHLRVRACSLGFVGHTSAEIASELDLRERFDDVVILAGVNDVVQHIGAQAYRAGVLQIIAKAEPHARQVYLVSIPRIDLERPHGTLQGRVKHFVLRHLNDGGQKEVTAHYRAAAPLLRTVEFDGFIRSYRGNEQRYMPDGLHLTRAEFARLGTYIGKSIPIARP